MKRCLISHLDLDGCGCLLVADYFKQDFDKIITLDYKDYEKEDFPYKRFLKFDEIVFTDMSPCQELLDLILDKGISLKVFDHHASFYELLKN